eukprot:1160503-Pelagomonas_calceolata.AAC.4
MGGMAEGEAIVVYREGICVCVLQRPGPAVCAEIGVAAGTVGGKGLQEVHHSPYSLGGASIFKSGQLCTHTCVLAAGRPGSLGPQGGH